MDIELGSRFRLFQTGRATLSPSYFLCVFWDDANGMTRPCIAQTIGDTLGPIVLELTEMGSPNYEDAEVELYAGDWQLTVYEQTSATNYDPALSGREVWSELVRVNVPATPPAPREPYDGPIVPDANRVCIVPCVYGTPTDGQVIGWNATDVRSEWQTAGGGGGGTGTVTTVSVATANGVSGSVANPTTTPAITLTLGAITPTSVAASGAVSGSNLSGTNTGDQSLAGLQPLDADLTAYANAADAAARRALIGAGTGNGDVTGGGTATGTNTGDQTSIVGITGTLAEFNTALTGADFATGGGTVTGTSSGTNTGDSASDPVGSAAAAQAAAIAASQPASDVSKAALAAQFDTSSTSYVDVTGFSVTLAANSSYYIDFFVVYQSPATGTGVGISLSFTNAPTVLMEQTKRTSVGGGNVFGYVTGTDTGSGIGSATTAGSTGTNLSCRTSGTVKTGGSASVMQVRFARGGSANTVSMMAGMSTINAHKI